MLARGRDYLARLMTAWGKGADWLIPLFLALAIAALGYAGMFRVPDGIIFDLMTAQEPARQPRVITIEQDAAFQQRGEGRYTDLVRATAALGVRRIAFMEAPAGAVLGPGIASDRIVTGRSAQHVPGRPAWRLIPLRDGSTFGVAAARTLAAPEYGIYRRQLAWLPGVDKPVPALEAVVTQSTFASQTYYVRMPRAQNMPRITATQLVNGELAAGELKDMIALVARPTGGMLQKYATPLGDDDQALSADEFSAYAIQTLADGRAVVPLYAWLSPIIILAFCLSAAALYRRFDPKRIMLPATVGIILGVFGTTVLMFQFAGILLPVSALAISQGLVVVIAMQRGETGKDRNLSRQVDRAVSVAFKRGSFDNQARLPEILLGSAKVLGMRHMILLEQDDSGDLKELGAIGAALDDLSDNRKLRRALFRKAQNSNQPSDAGALLPGWEGPVWIAWLGGAEHDIYWLYSLAGIVKRQRGERLAAAMIGSYRQLQRLRASLSAAAGRKKSVQSVNDRVTSALDLITGHDEQVRNGLDALDTAVLVYHLLGYPLHANAQMAQVFEEANLSLAEATLAEALAQLTELDTEQIAVLLHELLFRGGELRVPCRPMGARTLVLQIAAPFRVALGNERVVVLEAIDITNLKRLADLRYSVSNFIDTQLRNDLSAISLGASVASDERLERPALTRVINLITQAADRATERLESVAVMMTDRTENILSLAYPIDASKVAAQAVAKVEALAKDLRVSISAEIPDMGGYTIAEPEALQAMLEAILQIMIAETQPGDAVQIQVTEESGFTRIRLSGGFGVSFDSLCSALDTPDAGALPEYRTISGAMKQALDWKSSVSYWTDIGKGYRFNIELRRIA